MSDRSRHEGESPISPSPAQLDRLIRRIEVLLRFQKSWRLKPMSEHIWETFRDDDAAFAASLSECGLSFPELPPHSQEASRAFVAGMEGYSRMPINGFFPGHGLAYFPPWVAAMKRLKAQAVDLKEATRVPTETPRMVTPEPLDSSPEALERTSDSRGIGLSKADANANGSPERRGLLNVFTNGLADERFEWACMVLNNETLTVHEKLTKIHARLPFPPTASAEKLAKMLGVKKQSVLRTGWWRTERRGEKASEVGRRGTKHKERAAGYERPGTEED